MPFVPAVNTAMVELRQSYLEQRCENTLYFQFATAPSESDLLALGEAIYNWWASNVAPQVNENCGLQEVFVTDLTTDSSPAVSYIPGTLVFGANSSDPMPGGMSLAIKFSTNGRGRSSRGRNYVIGLSQNNVVGNSVLNDFVVAMVSAYNAILPVAEGIDVAWVVISRRHDNADRTTALRQPVTTVSATDSFIDSQRRRLAGRGT